MGLYIMGVYMAVFPELRSFGTAAARKEAIRRAANTVYVTGSLIGAILLLVALWCAPAVQEYTGLPEWPVLVYFGFCCGLVGFGFVLLARRRIRVSLRNQLNTQGIPVCVHCGYDLRGQKDGRCPECGRPFAPPRGSPRIPGSLG